jgi:antiviral helicase SKI2
MDFTDGYTKGLIRKFIKQKLQRLDEADRDLPQIRQLTGLLIRGIGVHHAGLLQLLKEIVEILFSDGYLKIVFATSTFAIGLNLPARCVVFTEMQKFNGEARSIIEASEYLQMAGRAGRRGKDDRGFSIICADPDLGKIPSNQEMLDLLDSKGVELASQLKIDYRTCLNILKQQQRDFGSMLQSSFFANEDMSIKLANVKQKKHVEPLFEKTKTINCIKGVPESIQKVYNCID